MKTGIKPDKPLVHFFPYREQVFLVEVLYYTAVRIAVAGERDSTVLVEPGHELMGLGLPDFKTAAVREALDLGYGGKFKTPGFGIDSV